MRIFEKKL